MERQYQDAFIPFTDVFNLGGPSVFTHLDWNETHKKNGDTAKNLIIVPLEFVEYLDEDMNSNQYSGAEDVLKFIQEAQKQQGARIDDSNLNKEGIVLYEVSEGLDLALVELQEDRQKFSVTSLEERIRKAFEGRIKTDRPTLMTAEHKYHIKYETRGMKIQEPHFLIVSEDIVNEGIITGNDELLAKLYENAGTVTLEIASNILDRILYPNQFIHFLGERGGQYARVEVDLDWNRDHTRIIGYQDARVSILSHNAQEKKIHIGNHHRNNILGISPKDIEQYIAMQYLLLNPEISIAFITGRTGSGKTVLTYPCIIDQILWYDQERRDLRGLSTDPKEKGGFFDQLALFKSIDIIGGKDRNVGFLPGDLWEKLRDHMKPYIHAHRDTVMGQQFPFEEIFKHSRYSQNGWDQRSEAAGKPIGDTGARLPPQNIAEVNHTGFIRGYSFRNTIIVIEEAQNLTPYELKTVLERGGEGCKFIVIGDPAQTDNPRCSRKINGLTAAINEFLPKPYSGLINLAKNYRSQVSDDTQNWKVYAR